MILEVGCSVGANLLPLAQAHPGASLLGFDVARRAVQLARARTGGCARVRVSRVGSLADVPAAGGVSGWPGLVDMVVFSEVLYYLGGPRGVYRELSSLTGLLTSDASAVLVHSSTDAPALHSAALDALGMERVPARVARLPRPRGGRDGPAGFVLSCARRSATAAAMHVDV